MLLLVALANVHVHTYGFESGIRGYPLEQATSDQVVTMAQMLLIDGRAFPLFAALFGYGLVQFATARGDRSRASVVALLRHRSRWLVLIGIAHAVLLMTADVAPQ